MYMLSNGQSEALDSGYPAVPFLKCLTYYLESDPLMHTHSFSVRPGVPKQLSGVPSAHLHMMSMVLSTSLGACRVGGGALSSPLPERWAFIYLALLYISHDCLCPESSEVRIKRGKKTPTVGCSWDHKSSYWKGGHVSFRSSVCMLS